LEDGVAFVIRKKEINIFVHLAHGYGAQNWNERYRDGQILGINEPFAYGYHRARAHGCHVTYSEDKIEGKIGKFFRLGMRSFLKFDFINAWRNRKGICAADVVWTHTESQHLAILLLFIVMQLKIRPKLIAQSVWLFDNWPSFTGLRRWLFTKLLVRADVLTVHSPENLKVARALFPKVRSELVLMGIKADDIVAPRSGPLHDPLRLLSVGNDQHRDWPTLIEAVGNWERCELRIVSQKVNPKLVVGSKDISLAGLKSNDELLRLYDWADILVLALKPNLHASGITVLEEAALRGVPSICSDVGGLKAYVSGEEITYVPAGDSEAIRRAILALAGDDEARLASVKRAQARMGPDGLSSESYVKRHVELSKELLLAAG
jgi:glycosyltransferase involved in cell wall biosynthesis